MPLVEENSETAEERRHHGRDTSCCALVFLILLLAATAFIIVQTRNIEIEYWLRQKIINSLDESAFSNIFDQKSANQWILEYVGGSLFSRSSTMSLLNYYEVRGPVVIRQCRSQETTCQRTDLPINNTYKCFYDNSQGSEKYTEIIGSGPESWRMYQSNTGFKINYNGEFGSYDTSGYIAEFDTSTTSWTSFQNQLNQMNNNGWLGSSTRALFIYCNLYQPSFDLWILIEIVIEFNTNAYAYPSTLNVIPLQPDIFLRNPFGKTADIFKIIFSLYILYMYIGNIFEIRDGKRNYNHAFSFQGIMDLLLIIMIIFSVAISVAVNIDEQQLYTNNTFRDLTLEASYYNLYYNVNAMNLTLIMVRILLFLTVNKREGPYTLIEILIFPIGTWSL